MPTFTIDGRVFSVGFDYLGRYDGQRLTFAVIKVNGEPFAASSARVSARDTFVRRTGRRIALARALQHGGFSREQRRSIWQQLFAQGLRR